MTITKEDINEYIQSYIDERENVAKALSKCDKRTYRYRYLRELYQYTQGVITGLNTLLALDNIKYERVRDYEFDEEYKENDDK